MGGGGADNLKHEKPVKKAIITGVAVLAEMLTGGLFLENIKMEKQRTSDPYSIITKRVLRQGLSGFWAGFWPWGCVLGLSKGIVLGGSRAFFLNTFLNMGLPKSTADITSGFCAGGVQGIFMSPILLARTRVNQYLTERAASQGKIQSSFFHEMTISMSILNQDIKKNGVSVLTIGMPTMVFKRAVDWGTRFVFMRYLRQYYYNTFCSNIPNYKLNDFEELGVAFMGGVLSVFVTMPIDRLMPIIQAANKTPNETIMSIIRKKYAQEGLATLQRGLIMRSIHCGWHTTFAIFISQKIYTVLDKTL